MMEHRVEACKDAFRAAWQGFCDTWDDGERQAYSRVMKNLLFLQMYEHGFMWREFTKNLPGYTEWKSREHQIACRKAYEGWEHMPPGSKAMWHAHCLTWELPDDVPIPRMDPRDPDDYRRIDWMQDIYIIARIVVDENCSWEYIDRDGTVCSEGKVPEEIWERIRKLYR